MSILTNVLADARRLEGAHSLGISTVRLFITNASFSAVVVHRMAHALWGRQPKASRLLSRVNLALHGADIDPQAVIGPGLLLQHPVGVVVGNDCYVGANVTMMSGVVLGRRNILSGDGRGAYPTIEDGCVLGAHAVVLGPVTIGRNSFVGANALVLSSMPPNITIAGSPARAMAKKVIE